MSRAWPRAMAAVLIWTAAWFLPWQAGLEDFPGLRSALGLLLFCVPGFCLQALLRGEAGASLGAAAPVSLLFSAALAGALGFVGSLCTLPAAIVGLGIWAAGAIGLAILAGREVAGSATPRTGEGWQRVLDGTILLAVMLITARLCFSPVMGADDMTYVARITWFQQTPTLSFRGIIFDGDQVISPRDWLAFWPLCEAVVATLARVHGLQLTTIYLGPLLGAFAVLAVYGLARALGLSRRAAVGAAALQIAALLLLLSRDQPGRHFFQRLVEDKFLALYVLGPASVQLVVAVLEGGRARARGALAVGWLGIALVHPTALGIVFLIVVAFCGLELIVARNRRAIVALGILVPITAAAASVRFIPTTARHPGYFGIEEAMQAKAITGARQRRVEIVEGTRFYGIGARSTPPFARAVGGLVLALALLRARRQRVARYVAAAVGIAALAIVPYTGWLLGKLLTPFHLWRILAAVPFGIGLTFALQLACAPLVAGKTGLDHLVRRAAALGPVLAIALLSATVAFVASSPRSFRLAALKVPEGWDRRLDARVKSDRSRPGFAFADLLAIARALDESIPERAVVLGDPEVNSLIPSLSAKATLVAFRSPAQTSLHSGLATDEARREWRWYQSLVLGELSPSEAVAYLRARDVRFVLTATEPSWLAAIPDAALPRRAVVRAGDLTLHAVAPAVQP